MARRTNYVAGSASGVRVWAGLQMLGVVIVLYVVNGYRCPVAGSGLAIGIVGGLFVRTFFMGVWVEREAVRIKGWVRNYTIPLRSIKRVERAKYSGALGFALGFIPFVGAVGVLAVWFEGERYRAYSSTLGRAGAIQRMSRRIRAQIDNLPDNRSDQVGQTLE